MHHGPVSQLDLPAVTRRDIDLPAGPIAALDTSPGPRRPALLVPGYTGSKEDFALVLHTLAAAGHRVMAVDQRGQFESRGPADPAAYSLDVLAADVHALLEELGGPDRKPVHLLGHSFGGLVARAATIARPAGVASLTLLDSGPAAIVGGSRDRLELLRPLLADGDMATVFDAMEQLDAPTRAPRPPELVAFLRLRFVSSSPVALRVMGETLLAEPDRVDALRTTGVPVLVAYGAGDDAWSPGVQAEMAARLGARRAVIPAAMHSPAVENPGETAAALLDFWAAVEAAADAALEAAADAAAEPTGRVAGRAGACDGGHDDG